MFPLLALHLPAAACRGGGMVFAPIVLCPAVFASLQVAPLARGAPYRHEV